MTAPTVTQQVKEFVRQKGLVRRKDVENAGFPTYLLYRLRDRGELVQLGPGLFKHPDSAITEKHTYAEVAKLVPQGVICLLSALAFHEIGTQMPRRIWIALERDKVRKKPRQDEIPAEFVWFSGPAFHEGQEACQIEGVNVRVYSPAKTVADLFKYRRKLGTDVAIEAIQDGWRERRFTVAEIERYADICNVTNVMRPYLQALVARS
jgi:predicted transcriptional regulator of viral defense system